MFRQFASTQSCSVTLLIRGAALQLILLQIAAGSIPPVHLGRVWPAACRLLQCGLCIFNAPRKLNMLDKTAPVILLAAASCCSVAHYCVFAPCYVELQSADMQQYLATN